MDGGRVMVLHSDTGLRRAGAPASCHNAVLALMSLTRKSNWWLFVIRGVSVKCRLHFLVRRFYILCSEGQRREKEEEKEDLSCLQLTELVNSNTSSSQIIF